MATSKINRITLANGDIAEVDASITLYKHHMETSCWKEVTIETEEETYTFNVHATIYSDIINLDSTAYDNYEYLADGYRYSIYGYFYLEDSSTETGSININYWRPLFVLDSTFYYCTNDGIVSENFDDWQEVSISDTVEVISN